MIRQQAKNISIAYNTRLPGFVSGNPRYVASLDGKIRTSHVSCPNCGSRNHVDNGYHRVEDSFVLNLGLKIKIAQFTCKACGLCWSTERELIDKVIQAEKGFLKSFMLGCVRSGISLHESCTLVQDNVGHTYSPQYLHELYTQAIDCVKVERASSASGVYYYDEQFLKVNGLEMCRLTVRDQVTGNVLVDKMDVDSSETAIKRALHQALDGLPVEAFTVDMAVKYPGIIAELFPKANIQWCIFHLDKLIWKELTEEFGKNPSLLQLYNAYRLIDLFFDHSIELKKLEEILQRFERYTGRAALPELCSGDFFSPVLSVGEKKSVFQTRAGPHEEREIENGLREEFRLFVRSLKKQRRREGKNVLRRSSKESSRIFATIKTHVGLFPKNLQHRIALIEKNWDRFTLFQRDARVQPTNNGVEQYFAATLSKTDKKDFRSANAVARELRACQAEWNGQQLFSHTTLLEVFGMVGLLFLAFPPG